MTPQHSQQGKQELQNLSRQLSDAANSITDDQSVSRAAPMIDEVSSKLTSWKTQYGGSGFGGGGGTNPNDQRPSAR